jgi:hypothetical protein
VEPLLGNRARTFVYNQEQEQGFFCGHLAGGFILTNHPTPDGVPLLGRRGIGIAITTHRTPSHSSYLRRKVGIETITNRQVEFLARSRGTFFLLYWKKKNVQLIAFIKVKISFWQMREDD